MTGCFRAPSGWSASRKLSRNGLGGDENNRRDLASPKPTSGQQRRRSPLEDVTSGWPVIRPESSGLLGRSFRLLEVRHSWSTEHRPLFWPRSLFSGLERGNRCSRCHSKSLPGKFDEGARLPIADLGRNRFYRTSCNQQLYSFHRTHLPSPHRRTRFSTRM
jgi:hypothetical protein